MKKIAILFLPFFILYFSTSQAQLPFADGFESGTLINWTADGDTAVINTAPYEGQACFQGTNFYQLQKAFAPITEEVIIIEFAMKAAQDNKESVDFLVYDESNNALVRIYFANMGYIYSKNGPNDVALKVYTWDVWYQTKIVINQLNRTYDIVIDGDTLAQNFNFVEGTAAYASRFYFSGSESVGSVAYIDDVSITTEASSEDPERDALIALYNSTGGAAWTNNTNWNTAADLGDWFGITTDINGNVIEINLSGNNLLGTIPNEIGDLSLVQYIALWANQIGGELPASLWNLSSLISLNLENNQISGTLPTSIANMTSLEVLNINGGYAMTGTIPDDIGSLNNLREIKMWGHNLSGTIPDSFWQLTNLEVIDFGGNELSGELPGEIGNLVNLNQLFLWDNQFEGNLPDEIGTLFNLERLEIQDNQFSGTITEGLTQLSGINYLDISNNSFDVVPESFAFMNINVLNADLNNFTFEDLLNLPSIAFYTPQNTIHAYDTSYLELGIEGLVSISFDNDVIGSSYIWKKDGNEIAVTDSNSFLRTESTPGTYYYTAEITNSSFPGFTLNVDSLVVIVLGGLVPSERDALMALYNATDGDNWTDNTNWGSQEDLGDWFGIDTYGGANVKKMALDNNNLNGSIPSEIGNLAQLEVLEMRNNNLSGELPDEFWTLTNLQWIWMENNDVSAIISDDFLQLANIKGIGLSENSNVTGSIPLDIGSLTGLQYLNFAGCNLSGTIPLSIGNLTSLVSLDLGGNQFNGEIPSSFWDITTLDNIMLYDNEFTGEFPQNLTSLVNLTRFNIGGSSLTGSLPSDFNNLVSLEEFSIWANNLQGNIPSSLWETTSLRVLDLGSNSFTGSIPPEIANLTQLYSFRIYWNQMSGEIPEELWGLTQMQYLSLSGNNFTGEVPIDVLDMTVLRELEIDNNQFSGTLPIVLTQLNELELIHIHNNSFELIPEEFLNFAGIVMKVENNELSFEDLNNLPGFATFNPQKTIHANDTSYLELGIEGVVILSFDNDVIGSSYIWKKDGNEIAVTDSNSFLRTESSPGTYYYTVEITNSSFPGFTLNVDSVVVIVSEPNAEKAALMAFYDATGGDNWTDNTNWASEAPLNEWYGVITDIDGHVVDIALFNNNLTGYLPTEIGDLSFLTYLGLGDNNIGGDFPTSIANLTNLEDLHLDGNSITGTLYTEMQNMTSLKRFGLSDNNFSGEIPTWISSWSALEELALSTNNFSGAIPSSIGDLSQLVKLKLDGNSFSGAIPSEIGNLVNLQLIELYINQLTGSIPSSIGDLVNLTELNLNSNQLTGEIPSEIGNLTNLQYLILLNNQLSGSIPSSIGNISGLLYLMLSQNQFSGMVPTEIGNLSNLQLLWLDNNQFEGELPTSIAALSGLTDLKVSFNNFNAIPSAFSSLTIESLDFINNAFSFEDLENLPSNALYDPQNIIHANDTTYLDAGITGVIQLDFDGEVIGSEYNWYREGDYMATTSGNSIMVGESDPGIVYFTIEITNINYPNFVLNVDSIVVITESSCDLAILAEVSNVTCYGLNDGSINISASDGLAPYQYSIDSGYNYLPTNIFNELGSGIYYLKVIDANLCESDVIEKVLTEPSPLETEIIKTDVSCYGDQDGEIEVTAEGGTPAYQYSIDGGDNYQTSPVFMNLAGGTYSVFVQDGNACTSSHEVTITEIEELVFTETIQHVNCYGQNSGAILVTASGGTPGYLYRLDQGNWQDYYLFSNLSAGEYELSVKDANQCMVSHDIIINEPDEAIGLSSSATNVQCFGGNDGSIELIAAGGVPPYEYSIDNGDNWQTDSYFSNLEAGEYHVMIQDENSCQDSDMIIINQPESLPEVSFTGLDAAYCEDVTEVILTGNQAPNGAFSGEGITDNGDGTANFNPALVGVGGPYELIYSFTDENACSNFEVQSTVINEILDIEFTELSANYCVDASIVLLIGSEAPLGSFNGPGITDNEDGTAVFSPAIAGAGGPYDIIYEYESGANCISQSIQQTTIIDLPEVGFSGLEEVNCFGAPAQLLIGSHAPDGSFTGPGVIDNNDGTAVFDPNIVGVGGPYTIIYSYTSEQGCSNSSSQQTNVYNVPTVSFVGLEPHYCEGDPEIIIIGSEAPNGSFSGPGVFDQGDGTALFYPVIIGVGGPYAIVYSFENSNACIGTATQETEVIEMPIVSFTDMEDGYCETNELVLLTGNYAPEGMFTGEGITDNGDGTAIFDPSAPTVGGPYLIKYEYATPEGCTDEEIQEVEIYQVDVLSFIGLSNSYCSEDEPILISGNLAPEGSFSGTGITDNNDGTAWFTPQEAGIGGPYEILYFNTTTFGCYSEIAETTSVNETPQLSVTGLGEIYCIDDEEIVLNGNQIAGQFSGLGISDNGDGTATWNPANAGAGTNIEIKFSYTSPESCYAEVIQLVEVQDFIDIDFAGLDADYCASAEPVTLIGSLAPLGSFTGIGIVDHGNGSATFSPAIAGEGGPYQIVYEYEDICMNTIQHEVIIHSATEVSFTGLAAQYCNVSTSVLLTGSQIPRGYFVGDGVEDNGDGTANFNPAILGVGGPYLITYHFENLNGCISYTEQETFVVDGPIASFDYSQGGCYEDAVFVDQSTSDNGNILDWNWNFDDPDSEGANISSIQNPLHQFVSNKSAFNIKLVVADELGCSDSITQLIEPFSKTSITGHVSSSDGDDISDGYVLAYLLSDGIISTQVDSVAIQEDASFTFVDLATCVDYIFRAYAHEAIYPGIMPRWHYEAYFWLDANPVVVNWDDVLVEGIDIILFKVVAPPEGSSGVSGGVYYTGEKGEPVKNVDVVLEFDAADDKGDVVVGYKPTNELGQWGFDQLGEGTFKISVDIPGLSMDSVYTVSISSPNTNITGLDYYIDPVHGIYIAPTGINELEKMSFASIGIFPNPNSGQFYLEIVKNEHISKLDIHSVELWDMEGRIIKDLGIYYKGDHYISHLNLSDIEPGMYFIKVKNKEEYGVVKFVIQR